MKRVFPLLMCLLLTMLAGTSCQQRRQATSPQGDTLKLRYAQYLTLVKCPGYTLAVVRNPWDTLKTLHTYLLVARDQPLPAHLPEGTVVRTPLTKAVVYSSVHCSLLEQLGALTAIGGICDRKYMALPALEERCRRNLVADCGDSMNPDIERMLDLHPDAVLLSPFENSGGYGRVEQLGIPLIECADYMETSALGRAEWMRFYGLLFGAEEQADSLFAIVDSCYRQLKLKAKSSAASRSVFCELKSSSAWYVPGGRSTMAGVMNDACGRYVFASDSHSGSVPFSFETVYDRAGDADIWIFKYNRKQDMTYADLQAEYAGYAGFKAFKERNIYACNTGKVPYYEETPFRPDYLLADYLQILHPELGGLGGLRYFCKLKDEGNPQ